MKIMTTSFSSGKVNEEVNTYCNALRFLTGREYDEKTAQRIWESINRHWQQLNDTLNRKVGFYVAALDYLNSLNIGQSAQYIFVEEKRYAQLLELSTLDGMTKLYNHQAFVVQLKRQIDFCRRKGHSGCLLMADIDNFKLINDNLGHLYGDRVLIRIAELLKQCLRTMDIAGRYGGEEFAVIFPETTLDDAIDIAERIRKQIEQAFQGDTPVTISMGLADFPRCGSNATTLIHAADQCLYRAKTSGKNQLICY